MTGAVETNNMEEEYASDDDYIVFEDDPSTTISEPCWSDIDSDEESSSSDDDASTDSDSSDSDESDSEDLSCPNPPTLVKHVRFSNEIVTHVIEIEDRRGYWVEDKFRFQQRCTSVRDAISYIFDEGHRRKMRLIVNLGDTTDIMPYSSGGM